MTIQEAEKIANYLFCVGKENEATRLILARDRETGGYANMGGWSKSAVIDAIIDVSEGRRVSPTGDKPE